MSSTTETVPDRSAFATAIVRPDLPPGGEDQARADLYALLSRLLLAAPDAALLDALASSDPILAEGGDPALERAWDQLTVASGVMDPRLVHDEFSALFVSVGTPPVDPYGSRYLAGYMNDTPLAHLREDLAQLGLARIQGRGEFEDHLGALCETMRVLVAGTPGIRRQPLDVQRRFFEAHIGSWCMRALDDIANADGANYYCLVARFAQAFLAIEAESFGVGEETDEQA
ncbi:TorD/DmsD family molecular chaperone [Massilia sp. CFBP9026]|uniref:TorD/DmsD family molecular chaperone n=1 Tax=Massilia sp. CFBP9026 TaxID=3096536 RepID=UPI002A6AAFDF|nr:molecular chaperone TorD family protein [Massilia sp. CFBP9026]MDY0960802.1 molecular chaperone TorD family protein [Massilia sp. CFBP9026]